MKPSDLEVREENIRLFMVYGKPLLNNGSPAPERFRFGPA
jgi:hypothetical protein